MAATSARNRGWCGGQAASSWASRGDGTFWNHAGLPTARCPHPCPPQPSPLGTGPQAGGTHAPPTPVAHHWLPGGFAGTGRQSPHDVLEREYEGVPLPAQHRQRKPPLRSPCSRGPALCSEDPPRPSTPALPPTPPLDTGPHFQRGLPRKGVGIRPQPSRRLPAARSEARPGSHLK